MLGVPPEDVSLRPQLLEVVVEAEQLPTLGEDGDHLLASGRREDGGSR